MPGQRRGLWRPLASLTAGVLFAALAACAPDALQLGTSTTAGAADAGRPGGATCHPHRTGRAGAKDEATCTPPCGAHAHCVAAGTCRCDTYFVFDGQGCVCAANTVAISVDGDTVCAPDYPAWGIGPLAPTGFVDHCDGTVTHELTGLTWQVDSTVAGAMAWEDARDYCDALELGGYKDWRLPTVAELVSSIGFTGEPWPGEGSPFVWDGDLSLERWAEYYPASLWTASLIPGTPKDEPRPWVVIDDAKFGATVIGDPLDLHLTAARCVRGVARSRTAPQRFEVDEHTVLDTASGRTWQRYVGTALLLEDAAHAYCATNMPDLPGNGWRVPDVRELMSLIDRAREDPAMDDGAFPEKLSYGFSFVASWPRWSSDKCNVCRYFVDWYWGDVMYGGVGEHLEAGEIYRDAEPDRYYVRCVRTGPTE